MTPLASKKLKNIIGQTLPASNFQLARFAQP
jgi:hypothetical protein